MFDFKKFVMPMDVNGDKRDCKSVTESLSRFESSIFFELSVTDCGTSTYAGDEKLLNILGVLASSAASDFFISKGVSDNERDSNLLLVIVALFL